MSIASQTTHGDLDRGELEQLIADTAALARKNSAVAAAGLHELQAEASRRDLPALVAECAYLRARAELEQGRLATALELIDVARSKWTESGHPLSAARTDLGRMAVLDDLGRHVDAIAVGTELVASLGQPLEGDGEQTLWVKAGAMENLGVSHGYLGRHREALAAHTEADELYRQLGCADEMVHPRANRGVELLELGDPSAALADLRAAAIAFRNQGDDLFVAKCLAYEARAQLLLGDYLACFDATNAAEAFVDGQETTAEFARIQLVRADTLTSMNLLDRANELYAELAAQFERAGRRHDHAAAEAGRGIALARLGLDAESRDAIVRSRDLYEQVGDVGRAAFADVVISELLPDGEALRLVRTTLPTLQADAHPAQYAAALLRLAQLEDDRQSLAVLEDLSALLQDHDLPHIDWMCAHERGRRLMNIGSFAEAAGSLAASRAGLDSIRATIDRDFERLPFMVSREQVSVDSIEAHLALGEISTAFELVERSRNRTLMETVSGSLARGKVERSAELDVLYDGLLASAPVDASRIRIAAQAVEADVHTATTRHAPDSHDSIEDTSPRIVYQILSDEIVAFVKTGGSDGDVRVVRNLIDVDELRTLQGRLAAQWRRFEDPSLAARQQTTLLKTVTAILQRLHVALIAPLDVLDHAALTIVPHGSLANIPFGALHDGTCHLIERMPLTVGAGPSVVSAQHRWLEQGTAPRRLVMGVVSPETPRVEDEVRAVGSGPNTTMLLNEEATVDALVRSLDSVDIVHIASHGIHRPDSPLFSAIQFADRWLTAGEIAGLHLSGQLVVLSTCSSGRQPGVRDHVEMQGLPRALLAAGAGAVVVNLWPVDDTAAHVLMRRFHTHLETLRPAEALRQAQCESLLDLPHPYRWAPSVLVGASTPNKEFS